MENEIAMPVCRDVTSTLPHQENIRSFLNQVSWQSRQLSHTLKGMHEDRSTSPARLSLEAVYYPLGFPLHVVSNSPAIHEAARQSWNCFQPAFSGPPLELHLDVNASMEGNESLPAAPGFSLNENLLVNAADPENFVITDLKRGCAVGCVTPTTAKDHLYLRYHFLEAAALSMVSTLQAVALHAACVRPSSVGVLLCGDSGAGKSSLSYAGARSGWTYISDDASYLPLHRSDRLVLGNSHRVRFRTTANELFPELNGRAATPRAAGKPSIEVQTSEWPELSVASEAVIDYVLFLNRHHPGVQELAPMRRSTALSWFGSQMLTTSESRPFQEAALSRLLEADIFELRYSDMTWAIARIDQLCSRGW